MQIYMLLFIVALFYALTPGILTTLPPKGSKIVVAVTHALIFTVVYGLFYKAVMIYYLGSEGFADLTSTEAVKKLTIAQTAQKIADEEEAARNAAAKKKGDEAAAAKAASEVARAGEIAALVKQKAAREAAQQAAQKAAVAERMRLGAQNLRQQRAAKEAEVAAKAAAYKLQWERENSERAAKEAAGRAARAAASVTLKEAQAELTALQAAQKTLPAVLAFRASSPDSPERETLRAAMLAAGRMMLPQLAAADAKVFAATKALREAVAKK